MKRKPLLMILAVFLAGCAASYTYETCEGDVCQNQYVVRVIEPSYQTEEICYQGRCEQVPMNRLLFKGGVNKTICNGKTFDGKTFLDNYWNSNGLIDGCEIPPKSDMQ